MRIIMEKAIIKAKVRIAFIVNTVYGVGSGLSSGVAGASWVIGNAKHLLKI
jgi:hypothetical protein